MRPLGGQKVHGSGGRYDDCKINDRDSKPKTNLVLALSQPNKFDKNLEANISEHIPSPLSKNRLMSTNSLSRMVYPKNISKVLSLLNHHSSSELIDGQCSSV